MVAVAVVFFGPVAVAALVMSGVLSLTGVTVTVRAWLPVRCHRRR